MLFVNIKFTLNKYVPTAVENIIKTYQLWKLFVEIALIQY